MSERISLPPLARLKSWRLAVPGVALAIVLASVAKLTPEELGALLLTLGLHQEL